MEHSAGKGGCPAYARGVGRAGTQPRDSGRRRHQKAVSSTLLTASLTILRQACRMSEWYPKRMVTAPRIDSRRHRDIRAALGSAQFEQLLDQFFNEAEQLLATLRLSENADQTSRLRHALASTAGQVGFMRLAMMARLATPDDVPILRAEIGRLQVDRSCLMSPP
jgi:hypothetical protein